MTKPDASMPTMDDPDLGQQLGRISFQPLAGMKLLATSLAGKWNGAVLTHVATSPNFAFSGSWSWFRLSAKLQSGLQPFPRSPSSWPKPNLARLQLGLPGMTYAGQWEAATESASLFIDPALFERTTHAPFSETALLEVAQALHDDPVIERLIGALLADIQTGCRDGPCMGESIVAAILCRLQGFRPAMPPGPRKRLSTLEVRRLHSFVTQQLSGTIHLSDLANLLSMSPRHLSRLVKSTLGVTPHNFVVRCRIDHAKALIISTTLPMDDIADRAGFADQSHLSATFRRVLNVTPLQIRHG